MGFNIVLIEPEIPNNTGNIGRLCLATGATLHLVRPLGFELDDKHVKRAGLDYWKHLRPEVYDGVDEFFEEHFEEPMAFFSSHGTKEHWTVPFEDEMFLIFGKESVGLSPKLTEAFSSRIYNIPMFSNKIRSLNLANAVAVVAYEGLRVLK